MVGEWGFASKRTQALLRKRIRRQRKFATAKEKRSRAADPRWRYQKLMRGGMAGAVVAEAGLQREATAPSVTAVSAAQSSTAAAPTRSQSGAVPRQARKTVRTTRFPPIGTSR